MINKPSIVAVIPVSGREELFGRTIRRLKDQEDVDMEVICVCDTEGEFVHAYQCGAIPLLASVGDTLGRKWQTGVFFARLAQPDAVMIVGSGNWFTSGWCKTLYPYLDDYDMVGSESMYALHFREKDKVMIHWGGYHTSRKGDMLGAGRMLSKRILDKADWEIYDTSLNRGLDKSMTKRLRSIGARELTLGDGEEKILKISSHGWSNINPFHTLWGSPRAKHIIDPDKVLKQYFPEALDITL
jgi:hypothetical protein